MQGSLLVEEYREILKLFQLAENINTDTAKELARERIEFMKIFIDEFLKEWREE